MSMEAVPCTPKKKTDAVIGPSPVCKRAHILFSTVSPSNNSTNQGSSDEIFQSTTSRHDVDSQEDVCKENVPLSSYKERIKSFQESLESTSVTHSKHWSSRISRTKK